VTLALAAASGASAAVVDSAYTFLGGSSWVADFTVRNDGMPATIDSLTVYFPEAFISGLDLLASPAGWDTMIFQPDLGIPAPGMLDTLAKGPGLVTGQSVGGFRVGFTLMTGGTPGSLKFDVNDSNYNVVLSGMTNVVAVPEPSAAALLALGLCAIGWSASRRRR
jgi:hypothetical protein